MAHSASVGTGSQRIRWLGGIAVAALVMSLFPPSVLADPDSSIDNFTADCAYIKQLQADPIKHPGQLSHWHDFFGNDRTDANSTVSSLKNATVSLTTVTMVGTTATFNLAPGVSHAFAPNQQVRVEGVKVGGQLSTDYNRVWTVSPLPSPNLTRFRATSAGIQNLPAGAGGTAGDATLSCGKPFGMLTYDTAGYWTPSIYVNGVHSVNLNYHLRVYYFAPNVLPGQTVVDLPEGLQLIGGKYDATSPADNPHLQWTCGHREGGFGAFDTPRVDHPYGCEPFEAYFHTGGVIDGPVGLLDMPYCWNGVSTYYQSIKYPEADGGSLDGYCDGSYPQPLIFLQPRLHMGNAWDESMNPCGGCLAYNLSAMHQDCVQGVCSGTFTVADLNHQFQVGDHVDVRSKLDPHWNSPSGGYVIASVDGVANTFTVAGLLPGLLECSPTVLVPCGTAAGSVYTENFTLAGTDDPSVTNAPFYTLHADFWNTWQQAALTKLEADCARGTSCLGVNAIPDNDFVDALP